MALHGFDLLGVLSGDADVLAVGPGVEEAVGRLRPGARLVEHLPEAASALRLDHEDASFGVILCAGAVERLAGLGEARSAALELHRVLRPGGVAAISLGFRLEGPAPGPPGRLLLDEPELRETLLGEGLIWATTSPLELAAAEPLVERDGAHAWTGAHVLLVKPLFH